MIDYRIKSGRFLNFLVIPTLAILTACGGGSGGSKIPASSSSSSSSSAVMMSYNLVYNAGTGGSISGQTLQSVVAGSSGSSVTAVAAANYRFAGWSDGSFKATRTDNNIQQNATVTANFVAADLWAATPYSGQMSLEVLGPRSINVVWEGNEARTIMVSTRNDVDANIGEVADVNWHVNVTPPFKLENLEANQPVYIALQQDDVITAWSSTTPKQLHADGAINSIELREDGTLFLAGDFSYVGPAYTDLVLLPDARMHAAYPLAFPSVTGQVTKIASDGDNGWYISGYFSEIAGEAREALAYINAQGHLSSWVPELGVIDEIVSMTAKDNIVYFAHQPSTSFTGNIMFLSAMKDGQKEPLFSYAIGELGFYKVNTMIATNEKIFVGGYFPSINKQPRGNLAALSLTGELLDWSPNEKLHVNGVAVIDDYVFVARKSDQNSLMIYDFEGNEIIPVTQISGEIKHIQSDGEYIYASGTIKDSDEAKNHTVVRFDKSGKMIPLENRLEVNPADSLLIHNEVLYFSAAGSTGNGLKAYSLHDKKILPWNPGTSKGASSIAVSDKMLLTLAPPRVIGGHPRTALASINTDEELTNWKPAINGKINSTFIHDEKLYIGGKFLITSESSLRYNAAAFSHDGEITEWNPSILPLPSSSLPWEGDEDKTEIDVIKIKDNIIYLGGIYHTESNNVRFLRNISAFDELGRLLDWRVSQTDKVSDLALTNEHVYLITQTTTAEGLTRNKLYITNKNNPADSFEPAIPADVNITSVTVESNDVYALGYDQNTSRLHIFKFYRGDIEQTWLAAQSSCSFRNPPKIHSSVTYKSRVFWGEDDRCYYGHGLSEYHPENGRELYPALREVSAISISNDQLITAGIPLSYIPGAVYSYKIYDLTQPLRHQ